MIVKIRRLEYEGLGINTGTHMGACLGSASGKGAVVVIGSRADTEGVSAERGAFVGKGLDFSE